MIWVFYLALTFSSCLFAAELIIPTPTLPSQFDPTLSLDVFSDQAVRQIHSALFRLDPGGNPRPDLAKSFVASDDGTTYTIKLDMVRFRLFPGTPAKLVKSSLERAIENRTTGFEKYQAITGFKHFMGNPKIGLSGITISAPDTVIFKLTKRTPKLIRLLADQRYAIVPNLSVPQIGLGNYEYLPQKGLQQKDVVLGVRTGVKAAFETIRYKKLAESQVNLVLCSKNSVFTGFYRPGLPALEAGLKCINKFENRSWQTYFLAINSKTLVPSQRDYISNIIDRNDIIKKCYPSENPDNNIVPFGFPGYKSDRQLPKHARIGNLGLSRTVKMAILNGVSSENCLKEKIQNYFLSAKIPVSIEVVDSQQGISDWSSNKYDLLFLYLEAEQNLDVFQFLTRSSDFPLGPNDPTFDKSLNKLFLTESPTDYALLADHLSAETLAKSVLIPFFNPKSMFLYSKNIEMPEPGIITPTYFDLTNLRRIGNEE